MLFPKSTRMVFRRNPLEEVVCQLKFPPILRIASESPVAFQEAIRERYPRYDRQQPAMPPEFSQALERFGLGNGGQDVTHGFLSADESSGVSLTCEFVAVWTRRYRRWEDFRSQVVRAQKAMEEVYSPSLYDRIGLRYRDVIDRNKLELTDVPWDELISAPLVGLLGERKLAGHMNDCQSQHTLALEEPPKSLVRIRHGLLDGSDSSKETYVIDADFHTTDSLGDRHVIDTLDKFNHLAGNFFRWAISDRLRDSLEPTEVLDRV